MSTGLVDNWLNIDTFGPIYPFVGTEMFLAVVGIAFWVAWHIWQIKKENAEFKADIENINKQGGPGKVLDDEARREMEDTVGQ
ncbi:MAG: hypothetical protein LJE92_04635 [Gammaproteobacteria bacterium]|jgi:hypothetical protein|nr:hypothetical protein [Gammaproteobacteria bacterium]